MRKKLFLVGLLIAIHLFAVPVWGQVYSNDDTLSIGNLQGMAGDSITLPVDLINTFYVGGIAIRISYDTSAFIPVRIETTGRSAGFELNGYNFDTPGFLRFVATSFQPIQNAIPPGSGPVANITMQIRPDASSGVYEFDFADVDSSSFDNSLSDSLGRELIIPIFVSGSIDVTALTGIDERLLTPGLYDLEQNYPNPFNQRTVISFTLNEACFVNLQVFDLLGRKVCTLYSGRADAGKQSIVWDGRADDGSEVSSGIYYYRISLPEQRTITKRMTLLK